MAHGQSKVQDFELARSRYATFGDFQVAVENPIRVRMVQSIGNLRTKVEHRLRRQPFRRNPLLSVFAWNVFHGDVGLAIDFADLVIVQMFDD